MGGFWRVDIFCESGEAYGLGHFYRALKLASLLAQNPHIQAITIHNRGDFTPSLTLPASPHAAKCELRHYEWLSTTPQMLDLAIIDSYEAEAWFYHRISHHAKALLCLDDTFRDVYPPTSYILNPTPHAASRYPSHESFRLLCGVEYMLPLLGSEGLATLDSESSESSAIDVFVSFGGVDRDNLTQSLISSLHAAQMSHAPHPTPYASMLASMRFHIVLGGGYPHTLQVPPALTDSIKIYRDLPPGDFLALARSCRLGISAGGGGMLELLALQIPSIVIEAAPNQANQIAHFSHLGAIKLATDTSHALALLPQLCDSYTFSALKLALSKLHFGEKLKAGLWHIIAQMAGGAEGEIRGEMRSEMASATESEATSNNRAELPHSALDSELIATDFCDIDEPQSELVLTMRNHPEVAKHMYATQITRSAHECFLHALKNDKTRKYWLLRALDSELDSELDSKNSQSYSESSSQSACLGVGSLTRINLAHAHAFIGIYANPLSPLPRKGSQILRFLESYAFEHLALHALHLEVMESNARARAFYTRHGYIEQGRLKGFVKRGGEFVDVILMYKERP